MDFNLKNRYCGQDCDDVIDLTESFDLAVPTLIPPHLTNTVIDLDTTDDSFNISVSYSEATREAIANGMKLKKGNKPTNSIKKSKKSLHKEKSPGPSDIKRKRISKGLGECPICCDDLGKNPLASTKCGHVYCLKCLEQSLKIAKKCPTCRSVLKGASAYHPLYLNY